MAKSEFYSNILDDYLITKTYEFDNEMIKKQKAIFQNFIKNKIPKNILGFKEISLNSDVKVRVNVIHYVFIKKHHKFEDGTFIIITPETAKKYKLSYEYDVHVDMNIFDNNKKLLKTANNIWLGSIPIMVGSCECKFSSDKENNGGYFIINGVEKILNKKNEL